jgi:hypothetical protein
MTLVTGGSFEWAVIWLVRVSSASGAFITVVVVLPRVAPKSIGSTGPTSPVVVPVPEGIVGDLVCVAVGVAVGGVVVAVWLLGNVCLSVCVVSYNFFACDFFAKLLPRRIFHL